MESSSMNVNFGMRCMYVFDLDGEAMSLVTSGIMFEFIRASGSNT